MAIERGDEAVRETTLEDVAEALGWPAGAVSAYLAGDDLALPVRSQGERRPTVTDAKAWILTAPVEEVVARRRSIEESHGSDAGDIWLIGALRMREDALRDAAARAGVARTAEA